MEASSANLFRTNARVDYFTGITHRTLASTAYLPVILRSLVRSVMTWEAYLTQTQYRDDA